MMRRKLLIIAGLAAAAFLSACSSGHHSTPAPAPVVEGPEFHFGAGFAADFDAPANSMPPHPSPSDIIPVDPTAMPINLH